MRTGIRLLLGAAALALLAGTARAETPKDTLIMADFIDDMISLDPAEAYEFSSLEAIAQFYDRLITYPPDNVADIRGLVAESWSVSDDGLTFTFKIRDGIKFHSGNPLTAKDVEYSLRRVIALNKTPAFILTQFGFSLENGDIDIARKLTPEDLAAVGKNPDVKIDKAPKGSIWYMGLNQKNPNLAK